MCLSFHHFRLGGILVFSYSQEGNSYDQRRKILYLFQLSVKTHTAYQTAAMTSDKNYSTSENPIDDISKLYDKFEALLDKKFAEAGLE